jgi:hypothetical protein
MFNDQLEFKGDGLIYGTDNDYQNNRYNDNEEEGYYYNDNNNEGMVINSYIPNEAYQIRQEMLPQEQLDYMIQNDINIFPLPKPKPLVYNQKNGKTKTKAKKYQPFKQNSYGRVYGKSSGYIGGDLKAKTKKLSINNNSTNFNNKQIKQQDKQASQQFNLRTTSTNGLFDPVLKKNELDHGRRSQKQIEERTEKIKNYDVKFGIKVKNLKVYNNYVDMLDDMINAKTDKDFNKPEHFRRKNLTTDNLNKSKEKTIKHISNNLEFDFTEYEQVIESLEKQIEFERAKRTEVNMKYFQKMKELEEAKAKKLTGTAKPLTTKARTYIRSYSTQKLYKGNTKFKKDLNKSTDIVRNLIPQDRRPKSSQVVRDTMNKLKPSIKQYVDNTYDNVYKQIIKNNKDLITKSGRSENKALKSGRKRNQNNSTEFNNPNNNHNNQSNNNINIINSQELFSQPNTNLYTNPMSNPMYNSGKYVQFDGNASIENKILQEVISDKNINKQFNNTDKLTLLNNLNREIDSYNKGIPQLIDKVEKTINSINKNGCLNEKLHPLIEMASKHSGKLLHLHLDELIELLIDEVLEETVYELERIEHLEKTQKNKTQFVNFVSNYYNTFELMRNIEADVSQKLTSKDYGIRLKPDKNIILYKNPFENVDNEKALKQNNKTINPNLLLSPEAFCQKSTYRSLPPDSLIIKCEKYKKGFNEYMKTTGAFYFPNIFVLYDNIVDEVLKDILDEQLGFVCRQVDNFAMDIFKDEILNK